jgi:hypothetical protein
MDWSEMLDASANKVYPDLSMAAGIALAELSTWNIKDFFPQSGHCHELQFLSDSSRIDKCHLADLSPARGFPGCSF